MAGPDPLANMGHEEQNAQFGRTASKHAERRSLENDERGPQAWCNWRGSRRLPWPDRWGSDVDAASSTRDLDLANIRQYPLEDYPGLVVLRPP